MKEVIAGSTQSTGLAAKYAVELAATSRPSGILHLPLESQGLVAGILVTTKGGGALSIVAATQSFKELSELRKLDGKGAIKEGGEAI